MENNTDMTMTCPFCGADHTAQYDEIMEKLEKSPVMYIRYRCRLCDVFFGVMEKAEGQLFMFKLKKGM